MKREPIQDISESDQSEPREEAQIESELLTWFQQNGIQENPLQISIQLKKLISLLLSANEQVNLTGTKGPLEFFRRHILDTLQAWRAYRPLTEIVYDVGSGGGIPGLVLALLEDKKKFVLVERRQKKARAIEGFVSELGLEDRVRIESRSFEALPEYPARAEYWFRGFLPGNKLAIYFSRSFPSPAMLHQIVLMKGPAWTDEMKEIQTCKGLRKPWLDRFQKAKIIQYELGSEYELRNLILL